MQRWGNMQWLGETFSAKWEVCQGQVRTPLVMISLA